MTPWLPFLLLLASTLALAPVTRWFGERLRGLLLLVSGSPAATLHLFFFLLLPGTLTHELSH
jgi:hypothetical protein